MGSPFYRFFRTMKLNLSWREWERLPRHPSFKYELLDGVTWISPRVRTVGAVLELARYHAPVAPKETLRGMRAKEVIVRQLAEDDWKDLQKTFALAHAREQPLASWGPAAAMRAARVCVDHARRGGEGELVRPACVVAVDPARSPQEPALCGAIIVTLVPIRYFTGLPEAAVVRRRRSAESVVAHLTFAFVAQWQQRRGIGTQLLSASVEALKQEGYGHLTTTIVAGNFGSLVWHWMQGFVPLPT